MKQTATKASTCAAGVHEWVRQEPGESQAQVCLHCGRSAAWTSLWTPEPWEFAPPR